MENKLFERITHYRIDLAYSKQNAYNAYKRISGKNSRQRKDIHRLNMISIVLSLLTLSSLMVLLSLKTNQLIYIGVSSSLSVFSLIINVYLVKNLEEENALLYLARAEEYSILYKKAKNIEARYGNDEQIDLGEAIKYFEAESARLALTPLIFSQEDFDATRSQIKNGDLIYSDDDFKNT